jgi:DNA polymerase-3 subunit delta'
MTEITPPLLQPHLFGHESVLKDWQARFEQGNFHHGMILSGAQGVGKATLCFHFIKWLLSQGKDNPHAVRKQIEAGSHPGLKVIARLFDEKKQRYYGGITVDAVEPIFEFLRLSQIDDGYRVIIIDGADTMNRHAQNSILKLLEEPPKKTFFFLLVEQAGLLLPTIRSRALVQSLAPLSHNEFTRGMQNLLPELDQHAIDAYFSLTHGVLGQALHWHDQNILTLYDELLTAAMALHTRHEKPAMAWAENYAPVAQDIQYEIITHIMTRRLHDMVRQFHLHQAFKPILDQEEALYHKWALIPPSSMVQVCDAMNALFERTENSHLDRKLTLLQALNLFSGVYETVA